MFTNNNMALRIVIPGGSGQVGTFLAGAFRSDGHEVVVLTRHQDWAPVIDGADVVINLAGRSVNCRYGSANRREILESRVQTTLAVGRAIRDAARPPRLWLQASTATIYAHRYDAPNDERTGIIGGKEPGAPDTWNFSIDVATKWERAFDSCVTPNTRKIALRSAMTMSPSEGGVFDAFASLAARGLGGKAGDGRQFVSWIHYEDFTSAIRWLIRHDAIDGVVNLAAPNPLPNRDFMRAIRQAIGVPVGIPVNRWMLEVGAFFMRTETELILKSRRVVPARLLESGFEFRFPTWPEAARALAGEWRQARRRN